MAVELSVGAQIAAEEDEAVQVTYNAESYADAVGIRFRDREGNPLPLEEGTDYSLRFYRDGAETDNLTDAGEIVVVIEGVGNYAGIAQRKLMILPRAGGGARGYGEQDRRFGRRQPGAGRPVLMPGRLYMAQKAGIL